MRSLAVLTTTAAVALFGAASAQDAPVATTTPAAAQAQAAPTGDISTALVAYAAFHTDVSDLRAARIGTANDLEGALDMVARHNRDAMTRGWVAYGANTAAQSPAFVQGVRQAADYYGRDAVLRAIAVDYNYARGLRGGNEAVRLVLDAATADGARIVAVADRYQEMAYELQRQRWANAVAPQQAQRVQRIRSLGAPGGFATAVSAEMTPRLNVAPLSLSPASDPTAFGGRRFWDALNGGAGVVEVSAPVSYSWRMHIPRSEAVGRMTSIAALQALDAAEPQSSAVNQLMNDPRSRDCLEMAQLQLYQCMSAARFRYENAFCLGQHGLRDVGTCISAIAEPDTAAMTPISSAVSRP